MAEAAYEDPIDSEELLSRMRSLNKKFKNACSQVILLNNQIEYLQVRYDGAVKANKRSYRYFLRLRLATLEGIRNMFYEYACRRADELDEMQDQLVQDGVIDSDYDMDDNDSDIIMEQNDAIPAAMEDSSSELDNNQSQAIHTAQSESMLPPEHASEDYSLAISQSETTIQNSERVTFLARGDLTSPASYASTPTQQEDNLNYTTQHGSDPSQLLPDNHNYVHGKVVTPGHTNTLNISQETNPSSPECVNHIEPPQSPSPNSTRGLAAIPSRSPMSSRFTTNSPNIQRHSSSYSLNHRVQLQPSTPNHVPNVYIEASASPEPAFLVLPSNNIIEQNNGTVLEERHVNSGGHSSLRSEGANITVNRQDIDRYSEQLRMMVARDRGQPRHKAARLEKSHKS